MTTQTIILINVGIFGLAIIFYIIWNLMCKNEKLEDALNKRDEYIDAMSIVMSESDRKIKEIDSKQIFESDDEIGWFFKGIKEIQALINEYNSNK